MHADADADADLTLTWFICTSLQPHYDSSLWPGSASVPQGTHLAPGVKGEQKARPLGLAMKPLCICKPAEKLETMQAK